MRKCGIRMASLLLPLLIALPAHAKRFRNAYVSFELPPNWNCKLEGSEWVCENEFSGKTKEAIIILTAKEVGPTDTLAAYMAHLQTPRALPGKGGQQVKSKVISVKERMISNQLWVDGMHEGSEVGPYFTRYLATIKDKIAILVTFSAHKEHYTKYSQDFMRAAESLRVVATKDSLGERGGALAGSGSPNSAAETIGAPIGQNVSPYAIEGLPEENGHQKAGLLKYILAAAILGGVGLFFFMRKNAAKPRPKPPQDRPKSKK